ncbi:MAG TPA: hypothetical protein VGW33_05010 [Terriglobia bacterium]|nr:hypothetical protein [Terriglobia bacterium]
MNSRAQYVICTMLPAIFLCSSSGVPAQDQRAPIQPPAATRAIPLTVPAGVPLHIALDKTVPVKKAGVPVTGHVLEPVYVFDHLVIPAGSQVLGRVAKVENASRKRRALAIANGNFSPLRTAHLDFDTLVLKDGTRIPLQTHVSAGTPQLVHLTAGGEDKKKKGRVGAAVEQARAEVKAREEEAKRQVKEAEAPGKMQRLKAALIAELPYHRPQLVAGTHFTAELKAPLQLGREECLPQELGRLGTEIPPGSTVHVRLLTPLSSATDHKGLAVQAVVSEPVFSSDHQLILPEGAHLEGSVTEALPARRLGRNGQLRFVFHKIDVGPGAPPAPRKVEASLQGVDAPSSDHMKLDSEGGAHAVTSKTKYIAPAIDVVLAIGSLDGLDPHNRDRIQDGLGPQGPDVAGGAVRGGVGLGLVGTVIGLVAHYRPVSAAFAFYGAGWSVYTHVVARGNDVIFPKNTPMEIRFGTHQSPAAPAKARLVAKPA